MKPHKHVLHVLTLREIKQMEGNEPMHARREKPIRDDASKSGKVSFFNMMGNVLVMQSRL